MAIAAQKIMPCLWFDDQAEDAAKFYCSIFKELRIETITRYGKEGHEIHGRPEGSVMVVVFDIEGQRFVGLNGGPLFKFTEAVSFQVHCKDQQEVDYYWSRLTAEGGQEGPCGWLKDKFGLSWQVVPTALIDMLMDKDPAKVARVTKAYLHMKKFNIEALRCAFDGK